MLPQASNWRDGLAPSVLTIHDHIEAHLTEPGLGHKSRCEALDGLADCRTPHHVSQTRTLAGDFCHPAGLTGREYAGFKGRNFAAKARAAHARAALEGNIGSGARISFSFVKARPHSRAQDGVAITRPKACRTMPAAQLAASVGIIPTLKRKIAIAAPSASTRLQTSRLARTGASTLTPNPPS
jgi:hypothetical protein